MFSEEFSRFSWEETGGRMAAATAQDVENALARESAVEEDIYTLLSPAAGPYLEKMARRSFEITRLRFGNTIQLYTPLYISNFCTNACLYCGFNRNNTIKRITLNPEQVAREAQTIYDRGFRHLLLLTGEDTHAVPVDYLEEVASSIHNKFSSVSIEVYPMEVDEYRRMTSAGVDGLTLYQETYDRERYAEVHPSGRKRDFIWRLDGPDRGGMAGFRKIGVGTLLGLSDWRQDAVFTALHALYLTRYYWKSHIQVSFPRLRAAVGSFKPRVEVTDRELTQIICAMRIILPDASLVLSTRESAYLRDNLMPIGITMMSAGSKTEPGGYTGIGEADEQFSIVDTRSPAEVVEMIQEKGFDPVWKDWDREFIHDDFCHHPAQF